VARTSRFTSDVAGLQVQTGNEDRPGPFGPGLSPSRAELPGIEPAAEIALTCADAGNGYAKRRENIHNDLRIRDRY